PSNKRLHTVFALRQGEWTRLCLELIYVSRISMPQSQQVSNDIPLSLQSYKHLSPRPESARMTERELECPPKRHIWNSRCHHELNNGTEELHLHVGGNPLP